MAQLKANIALFSELPPAKVERANLQPIADMNAFTQQTLTRLGPHVSIAVLPESPMTILYLKQEYLSKISALECLPGRK